MLIRSIEASTSDVPQGVRESVESLRNEAVDEIQKGTLRPRNLALARGMESGWNRAVSVPELRQVGTCVSRLPSRRLDMLTRKDRVKRSRVYMRERPWQYSPNRLFPLGVNSINDGTLQ